jgi:hypothetical protein
MTLLSRIIIGCFYQLFICLSFSANTPTLYTEWYVDYLSGDGVLMSINKKKEFERLKLERISGLRVNPTKKDFAIGNLHYTCRNAPIILMFEAPLETKTARIQSDEKLQLSNICYRYCWFAGIYHHLTPTIENIIPYEPLQDQIKILDVTPSDSKDLVYFNVETPYIRPLCKTTYIQRKKCYEPITSRLLRYEYDDDQKKAQAVYERIATHQGRVIFSLPKLSVVTLPYIYIPLDDSIDISSIRYTSPTSVSYTITESWKRPGETTPEIFSKSVESPIETEYFFMANDAELYSVKRTQYFVMYNSRRFNLPIIWDEPIPYEEIYNSYNDAHYYGKEIIYKRGDGSIFRKTPDETDE